ncbi:MAG: hypothetical protein ACRD4O_10345 [Bryobacteraceae bacterium]
MHTRLAHEMRRAQIEIESLRHRRGIIDEAIERLERLREDAAGEFIRELRPRVVYLDGRPAA